MTPHPAHATGPSWFALQVKTTHEKRVVHQLDQKGYERFLPLYLQRRRWSDRIKEVEQPLFPGYVFCRFAPHARTAILKTVGVVRVVGFGAEPAPVDDEEILAIQYATQAGLGVCPHPFLTAGQRVRIESGPLMGVEGLVVELRRRHHLILSVSLLQSSMSVEIDSAWVTPISSIETRGTSPGADRRLGLPTLIPNHPSLAPAPGARSFNAGTRC